MAQNADDSSSTKLQILDLAKEFTVEIIGKSIKNSNKNSTRSPEREKAVEISTLITKLETEIKAEACATCSIATAAPTITSRKRGRSQR